MVEIHTNLFLSIGKYSALNPMAISPIGELSKKSLSFSKDINFVSIDNGLAANVFYTKTIDGNTIEQRSLDDIDKTNIKNVLNYYYDEIEASSIELSVPTLVSKFAEQFPNITDVTFETIVNSPTNKHYYGFFKFGFISNNIKRIYNVWCADGLFQSTYPITEFIVVPVFQDLTKFWRNPTIVISDIENSDPYEHIDRVQTAIGDLPPTGVIWLDYPYVDPVNSSISIPVKWAVVHYGSNASTDALKNALVTYLTTNDNHTSVQWKTIFPDIFSNTKFIFYPLWNDYSISNMQVGQTGIFKNGFKIKDILQRATSYFNDYDQAVIEENIHYMPMPYKSIGIISMPGTENPSNRMSIDSVYPDIINITSVNADYNRMSFNTQNFLSLLNSCLTSGETFTNTTTLPSRLYRVVRLNKTFIAFTFNGAEYLIAPKNAI